MLCSAVCVVLRSVLFFRKLPAVWSVGGNQHRPGGQHEQQHFLQVSTCPHWRQCCTWFEELVVELGLVLKKKKLCRRNVPQHAAGSRSTVCAKAFRKRKCGGASAVLGLNSFVNVRRLSHKCQMVSVLIMWFKSCCTLPMFFFSRNL